MSLTRRIRSWFRQSWLLYAFAVCMVYALALMPRGVARLIGKAGGYLAYLFDRSHRKLCFENLSLVFPEKSHAEHVAILKKCYIHLGTCAADFCQFIHVKPEDLRGKWIVSEDGADERARKAVAEGRGVIAIGAHIGFWELSGFGYPTLIGRPVVSVSRRIPAERIDALVNGIRARLGNAIVQKEGALRPLLRALKENNGVGVIMDQHGEGAWVPFFGRECSTIDSCARLHLKLGSPMLCNFMLRQSDGRYLWRCREVKVELPEELSQDEKVYRILEACNREFEGAIRAAPEQWLWMHKRWRKKPAGADETRPKPELTSIPS